ncbi:hypothetical protein [Roseovarius faecimaris]|nr:hypothetical protein [Roseovarius faecimaris]
MRIFATLATAGLLALTATGPVLADGHGGHSTKCVPFGCYDR